MKVTIYSRVGCAPCISLKRYLTTKGIKYEELSLDDKPELADKIMKQFGYMIVPITVIGDEVVAGLNFARLSSLLKL